MLQFAILVLSGLLLRESQALPPQERDGARAPKAAHEACEAWRRNRALFADCRVKYRILKGEAASVEEGFKSTWRPLLEISGDYRAHGEKKRLELAAPTDQLRALEQRPSMVRKDADGRVVFTIFFEPHTLIDDGVRCLSRKIALPGLVRAERGEHYKKRCLYGPFDMGVLGANEALNPSALLQQACASGHDITARADGTRCEFIIGSRKEGWASSWILDLAKGGLAVEHFAKAPSGHIQIHFKAMEAAKASNDAFFVSRARLVTCPSKGALCSVKEFIVDKMEIAEPKEEEFSVTLPANSLISHDEKLFPYLKLKSERVVNLGNLNQLIDEAENAKKNLESRQAASTQHWQEQYGATATIALSGKSSWTFWVGGAGIAVSLCLFWASSRSKSS